jgi:hypothetical protein
MHALDQIYQIGEQKIKVNEVVGEVSIDIQRNMTTHSTTRHMDVELWPRPTPSSKLERLTTYSDKKKGLL